MSTDLTAQHGECETVSPLPPKTGFFRVKFETHPQGPAAPLPGAGSREMKRPHCRERNVADSSLLAVTQRGSGRDQRTSRSAVCRVSVGRCLEGLLLWSVSDLPPLSAVFNPSWDPGRSDEKSGMLPIVFPMFMLGLASHLFVISLFHELIYSPFREALAFARLVLGSGVGLFGWLAGFRHTAQCGGPQSPEQGWNPGPQR